MVHALSAAQYNNDLATAEKLTGELRAMHVALGFRQAGTREEQNTYLMARSTRTPMPELAAVGINTNDWPAPPSSPTAVEPESASPDTEQRISDLFQSAGPLSDRWQPTARYKSEHRPQDNQRYRSKPLPWAICDTVTGLPVAYVPEQDLAEYQADQASRLYNRAQEGR
jgi:hypothetical protein